MPSKSPRDDDGALTSLERREEALFDRASEVIEAAEAAMQKDEDS